MRLPEFVALGALAGLLASVPLVGGAAKAVGKTDRADTMDVDDIKPKMKGYGLTVFEGTEPAKFDVEVIDVLRNFRPGQDLILIKTPHPRLNVAKIVAGMSGSPIFIDGKMIGAYAYGWTFGEEPVAGVTPIRNMIADIERPLPDDIFGWPYRGISGKPASGDRRQSKADSPSSRSAREARLAARDHNRFDGAGSSYDLVKHARQLEAKSPFADQGSPAATSPLRPVATPVLMGGLDGASLDIARELFAPLGLEPLQAGGGGGAEPGAPSRYVDGGAVGVQLVRGDMSATALGTVTRVEGDKLVAFGHPMMNAGATAMPTAVGRVLWFMASKFRSFKVGMPVRPLGAMVMDRQASIVVSHKAQAPTVPTTIRIHGVSGAPKTEWNFEIAHEKFVTPSLVAVALGNSVQAAAAERQDVSWTAKSKFTVKGYGEIEVIDYGVAIGGTPDPRDFIGSNLVRGIGAVLNNIWEPALVESVEMDIELRFAREMLRLKGAEVLDPEVDAGQSARIRLTLLPYAGKPIQRVIKIPMPKHLAGEKVTLSLMPGYIVEKDRATPENLRDLLELVADPTYPPKTLVVSYDDGSGVAFKGNVAHDLPPGALDSLRPTSATLVPESFKSNRRHVIPLQQFMVGTDRVSLEVKPIRR